MSFRRAVRFICGVAGGSAVLVYAATAAESRGYFGETQGERQWFKTGLGVLHAAQPSTLLSGNNSVQPSGNGWDSNWDKYVCVFETLVMTVKQLLLKRSFNHQTVSGLKLILKCQISQKSLKPGDLYVSVSYWKQQLTV